MIQNSPSFLRMATVTASINRNPAPVSGVRGAPIEIIASIKCTPLDPVEGELRMRLSLDTPHELLQTFFESTQDIREGDVVVVGTKSYPIRSVESWSYLELTTYHCILEELKK